MVSSFTSQLNLEKHVDGDTAWGTGVRKNWDDLDSAIASIKTITFADTPYTLLVTDRFLNIDAGGGAVVVDLLAVATTGIDGRPFVFKLIDAANTVTMDGNAAENIDGSPTIVLSNLDDSITLTPDATGGEWRIEVPIEVVNDPDAIHKNVAAEISTVTEKVTPVGADLLLGEDSASGNAKVRIQISNLPSGGASLGAVWTFRSPTTDADPGSKNFRMNNATQNLSTQLFVSEIADSGVDTTNILLQLEEGDRIYIQQSTDATKFHLCRVTGPVVDAATYLKIPIVVEDSGVALTNNKKCGFIFSFSGGATTGQAQDAVEFAFMMGMT